MPTITNLTGTTWIWKNDGEDLYGSSYMDETFSINFISKNTNYSSMHIESDDIIAILSYGNTDVFSGGMGSDEWKNQAYRTITITGGSDVTNSTLISWLEADATQAPPFPTYTFDLSTLNLPAGNYTITVKTKVAGYKDSVNSNSETYSIIPSSYPISTTVTNGSYSGASSIAVNGIAQVTISADSGYTLPLSSSNITVTNATLDSYNSSTGVITVSNPVGNVSISTACPIVYSITTTVTNGTYSGNSTIIAGSTATVTISANQDYALPSTITVTNATYTYDSTTGVVSLSVPTGNVTISVVCPSALPQLDTPTNLSVSGTTATFDEVENAESYEFFVDGQSIGEYTEQSGYDLTLNFIARNERNAGENCLNFKINGAPSESADFDYYLSTPYPGTGGYFQTEAEILVNLNYDEGGTYTIHNVTSVTMWIDYDDFDLSDYIFINGTSYSNIAPTYPGVTMNLSENTTVNIYYDYGAD